MPLAQFSPDTLNSQTSTPMALLNNRATTDPPHWYATYTCSRREKQISRLLDERHVQFFLPLYQKLRRHNRGMRRVFLPLFPGYIFVRIPLAERIHVLEVPGLGGHCIPVDPFYLSWKAREWDFHTRFIELAGEINVSMPYHVVNAVSNALNHRAFPLSGARVLILGVAYKKDVDDLRESPALTIIELLRNEGAIVSYNDPYVPHIGRGRKYNLDLRSVPLAELAHYDCVLILTDHSDYDYRDIVSRSRLVIDTRNATRGITSKNIVRC